MTFEEFIQKAKAIHGDKYDYSKVEYVNTITKVSIVCPVHGEFLQSPKKHLYGQGCSKCHHISLANRFSLGQDEFIKRANLIHNNFYDYNEVDYINVHTHVKIICPSHGMFKQAPASHLKGHGCPVCADIINGNRKRKWTNEKCIAEAKKYTTKTSFQKGNPTAYLYARKNGLLNHFDWFKIIKNPNGYWTKERCAEESRKYSSKKEFVKGSPAAHNASVKNGWLDDFVWLVHQRIDIITDRIDSVYIYLFEETKTAYVGRTLIRRQKKRDQEHIFNQDTDAVARYAREHNLPVPEMKIIETNLTLHEGQDREDYWRKWYESKGYFMLNKIATGIGKGSLGAIGHGKWNRKTCADEAKKYKSLTEFEVNSSGAYAAALRNGWLKDYVWFATLKRYWNEQTCYREAKKCKTRGEFYKKCSGAYIKSLKMGWMNKYTWLLSRQNKPTGYWNDYNNCYEESLKHNNRRSFQRKASGAYSAAVRNNWLDEFFPKKSDDKDDKR